MSHIYGSNGRNGQQHKGGNSGLRGDAQDRSDKKSAVKHDKRKTAVTALIINTAVTAVMIALSFILISSADSRVIYTNFLFLPVSAFAGAFLSFLINRDLLINALCSAAVFLIAHLIFVECSFWAILWLFFYMLNAFIGYLAGLVARTFR